jgi:hypothetical protein
MKERIPLVESCFKVILLVLFGTLYFLANSYPEKSRQFPQLVALFGLVSILVSFTFDLIRERAASTEIADVGDTELKVVDEGQKKERRRRFYLAWAIILVSTGMGFLIGFLFTTFLLFVGFALFFGRREILIKNILIAVAITAAVYFVFQRVFGVPLLSTIF